MVHDLTLNIILGQAETCLSVIKPRLPASFGASPSAGRPMTHLAQTSSGSIHSVNSGGRPSSRGVSSLSSHAFRTTSQRVPLFIRIHLRIKRHYRSQLHLIATTMRQPFFQTGTCMPVLCWGCRGTSGFRICRTDASPASRQTVLLWFRQVSHMPPPSVWGSGLQPSPLFSWCL